MNDPSDEDLSVGTPGPRRTWGTRASNSDQLGAAGESQFLDDFAYILGVVAVGDQQRILGVHNDQVLHAYKGDKLLGAVDVVVTGVEGHVAFALGHVAFPVSEQPGLKLVLVKRGPGAQVVPTEFSRDAIKIGKV